MLVNFDQTWSAWLRQNIARGCNDNDLLRDMAAAGLAEEVARAKLQEFRASPQKTSGIRNWKPVFEDQNIISLDGHRVAVSARFRDPSVAVLNSVLTPTEAADLIDLAKEKMSRSTTVDDETGQSLVHHARTSLGGFFSRDESPLVSRLDHRLSTLMGLPHECGEGLQVLCYEVGGEYRPHHDFFRPGTAGAKRHMAQGGQRIATMVVYLNDVEAGGETVFPQLGLSASPRTGCATYFAYGGDGGPPDERLLHSSEPVRSGQKWVATKWMRESPF